MLIKKFHHVLSRALSNALSNVQLNTERRVVLLLALLVCSFSGECSAWEWNPFVGPHYFSAGPEVDYMRRSRDSGSTMDGCLFGGWGSYDRFHPMSWYYGVEGYWVSGHIDGNFKGTHTKAYDRDSTVLGKVGLTFQSSSWRQWTLIPFVGYGYFCGVTKFSPRQVAKDEEDEGSVKLKEIVFHDTFKYYSVGFLSWAKLTKCVGLGINFKWNYMNDGKQRIDDDPQFGDVNLTMNDKSHYEVDFPLTYSACFRGKSFFASLVPFYRFRQYGGRENYPFDFATTIYHIGGARFVVSVGF
jgi:hypothetical protein